MTPKEEALALFEKYLTPNLVSPMYGVLSYSEAKQCTLIAVEEIQDILTHDLGHDQTARTLNEFYDKVKTEINSL
jgi:hypothetical protein